MLCEKCGIKIKVGLGGMKNLSQHQSGGKCSKNKERREKLEKLEKTRQSAARFFTAPKQKVPATVSTPSRISSTSLYDSQAKHSCASGPTLIPSELTPVLSVTENSSLMPIGSIPCLNTLREFIVNLPMTIPEAGDHHPFAQFSGDLSGSVPEGEDAWETWDGPLNTILQQDPQALQGLVAQGNKGLTSLHRFLSYLASTHRVPAVLFENKVKRVIQAIMDVAPAPQTASSSLSSFEAAGTPVVTTSFKRSELCQQDRISDRDELPLTDLDLSFSGETANTPIDIDLVTPDGATGSSILSAHKLWLSRLCGGLYVKLPAGVSAHGAYPTLLHESIGDPWDYTIRSGRLYIQSRSCLRESQRPDSPCAPCAAMFSNSHLLGIMDRMRDGVNENLAYKYHRSVGLVKIARVRTSQV